MHCPKCNSDFPDHFVFCDVCGGKLEGEAKAPAQEEPNPYAAAPQQPVYTQPAPMPAPAPIPTPASAPTPVAPYRPEPPKSKETVSFWTWFFMNILNVIPFSIGLIYTVMLIYTGVQNLESLNTFSIVLISFAVLYVVLMIVFALINPKKRSLKTFAAANIIMSLIVVILLVAAYFLFKDAVSDFIDFDNLSNFTEFMNY